MKPKLVRKPGRALLRAYSMWAVYLVGPLDPPRTSFHASTTWFRAGCRSSFYAFPLGRIIHQGGIDADD